MFLVFEVEKTSGAEIPQNEEISVKIVLGKSEIALNEHEYLADVRVYNTSRKPISLVPLKYAGKERLTKPGAIPFVYSDSLVFVFSHVVSKKRSEFSVPFPIVSEHLEPEAYASAVIALPRPKLPGVYRVTAYLKPSSEAESKPRYNAIDSFLEQRARRKRTFKISILPDRIELMPFSRRGEAR
jgi:hypothetical protein